MVQELTGQVRDCLDRAAERVMDRLEPARFARSGQSELALAGGRDGREKEPDLATRLRDAWEARLGQEKERPVDAPEWEASQAPQDLAARLREAAEGVDREGMADRAAALREGREAEERVKELERQQEIERDTHRDRGHEIER